MYIGGDLQNAESIAEKIIKLAYTVSGIQVTSDRKDTFKRISGMSFIVLIIMDTIFKNFFFLRG
jgi:hypothetical protein